ncbi:MAG: type II toxin-antitoxin system RelE/ParE family toxin [Azospirillaceae bacterium]|nr:type II toxin-antitoxin system RelE/ParE family toxin [Azospirillaceae bacterium]
MTQVLWSDDALSDIEVHVAYIDQFNPEAANRLARALLAAGHSLAMFPQRGRPGLEPDTRELTVAWPYVIVYRVRDDMVEIARVWHGAQER